MIRELVSESDPAVNFMDFQIAVVGEQLTVLPGPAKIFGEGYLLKDPVVFILEPSDEVRSICGYLAEARDAPGRAVVVVDEISVKDPMFDFASSPYRQLTPLFEMRVPPQTSLEAVVITVHRFVPAGA